MGLDMYLYKVKKADGVSVKGLEALDNYFSWETRGEEYKDDSLYDWCHTKEEDVPKSLVEAYRNEYVHRYSSWDKEHKYGFPSIFQQVAYWRKANQIHSWFVNNVQDGVDDCDTYEVSEEQLKNLLEICEVIYDNCIMKQGKIKNGMRYTDGEWEDILEDGWIVQNPELALELLQPTEGFFFGSTDINQYYMEDIKYTIDAIKEILDSTDFDKETICYHSSW